MNSHCFHEVGGPVNLLSSYSALFVSLTRNAHPYCNGMIKNLHTIALDYGSNLIKCVGEVSLLSQTVKPREA